MLEMSENNEREICTIRTFAEARSLEWKQNELLVWTN